MGPDEQRQSTRFPQPQGRAAAVLRVGRRSLSARLVNTSAGGFAIRLPRDSALVAGQTAVLGSGAGWFRVRVVHVRPDDGGVSVGLERTAELPIDWHPLWILRVLPIRRLWIQNRGLGWSHCALGGFIVCVFVVGAVFWKGVTVSYSPQLVRNADDLPSSSPGGSVGAPSPRSSGTPTSTLGGGRFAAGESNRGVDWGEQSIAGGAKTAASWWDNQQDRAPGELDLSSGSHRIGNPVTGWMEIIDASTNELPDASLLLSPDVQRQLQITAEQRTEIASIVKANNEAVEAVYRRGGDASSPAVKLEVTKLRRSASKQAIALLSSEQKQQLRFLRKR